MQLYKREAFISTTILKCLLFTLIMSSPDATILTVLCKWNTQLPARKTCIVASTTTSKTLYNVPVGENNRPLTTRLFIHTVRACSPWLLLDLTAASADTPSITFAQTSWSFGLTTCFTRETEPILHCVCVCSIVCTTISFY